MVRKLREKLKETSVESTVYKYQCDYKRLFAGTDFEKADIRDINSEHIWEILLKLIQDTILTMSWI